MNTEQILEITGTLVGLVYLWQEYRASIYLWITGTIMPAIYIYVYYKAGLYADFGLQIYYLLAAVYGLIVWKFGPRIRSWCGVEAKEKVEQPIARCPLRAWPLQAAAFVLLYAAILYVLKTFTDSTVPYWDSFVNALSIIGLWQLSRKYIEQWFTWIVVDVACSVLYVYKGLYPTAGLYFLYAVIAVFGYLKWKRMMKSA